MSSPQRSHISRKQEKSARKGEIPQVTHSAETKATRSQTKRTSSGNVIYSGILGDQQEEMVTETHFPSARKESAVSTSTKRSSATLQSLTKKQAGLPRIKEKESCPKSDSAKTGNISRLKRKQNPTRTRQPLKT